MLTSFKNYGIFLIIAALVAGVLLSNKAGVNLTHHHELAQLTQKEKIYCSGIFSKKCHVRLSTAIGKPEIYRELFHLLNTASSRDTIYIYLMGAGGQVQTTLQMYNVIKSSKAKIITVVEGDVYSAHAFIAAMGSQIKIGDHILFLVHTSSAYGKYEKYCEAKNINQKGEHLKDRNQSAYDKCMNYYRMQLKQTNKLIITIFSSILTKEELKMVLEGHDVILTGEELKRRIK